MEIVSMGFSDKGSRVPVRTHFFIKELEVCCTLILDISDDLGGSSLIFRRPVLRILVPLVVFTIVIRGLEAEVVVECSLTFYRSQSQIAHRVEIPVTYSRLRLVDHGKSQRCPAAGGAILLRHWRESGQT